MAQQGELHKVNLTVAERIKDYMTNAVKNEKSTIVQVINKGVIKEKVVHGEQKLQDNLNMFFKAAHNKGCAIDLFRAI